MYRPERLVILDADGTTIDAFGAINQAFSHHGMDIGELHRFQKRRNLFKYLGGIKEFPRNLKLQIGKRRRRQLIETLTEIYREEASLYDGMREFIEALAERRNIKVGVLTRNITLEPVGTLNRLYERNGVSPGAFDFFRHIPLKEKKISYFKAVREDYRINPARCYACGDEKSDYQAAIRTGVHPFMVSYGFENYDRLTATIGVPAEVIARNPNELIQRVFHALDIG